MLALFAVVAALAARPITLDEALALAQQKSVEIEAAQDAAVAAKQDSHSAFADQLPQMRLTASGLDWDSPFSIAFGPSSFEVRKKITSSVDVTAYQPITGLYPARARAIAARDGAAAAESDVQTVREAVKFATTEKYLRLLEAIDLQRIADARIKDVEEQRRIANSLVQAGTLIRLDLLRTDVALADAKQDAFKKKSAVGKATAVLDIAVGLSPLTELTPAALDGGALPHLPDSAEGALAEAAKKRPEIASARARADAAGAGHHAAIGAALPQIGVIGQYEHLEGIEFGQPMNAYFIGGNLSWTFLDWGKAFHAAKAAGARAKASGAALEGARLTVSLDVTTRFLEAQSALAQIELAHAGVAQAEEAYSVQRSRYENGDATTTDLLDAERALATARSNDASARYEYRIAYANFSRAASLEK